MDLAGKVALVTGAGQGIGEATARALAEHGAAVAVADINPKTLEAIRAEVEGIGRRSVAIRADLGELADIERMVAETAKALGGVDILVNNAGVTRYIPILDISEQDWDRIHRVNAKGAFFCMQKVAARMIEQGRGGRIINIASVAGQGWSGASNAAYSASKGAVIAMTRMAAHAFGPHDINVNAICPGVTATPLIRAIIAKRAEDLGIGVDALEARITESIPIGRLSEAEDIAAMALFLAGPGARNVSGQCLNVDGGLVMH